MVNLTVPGVKIEEVTTLPPSVAPVDTAIPAFVGHTQTIVAVPTRISSFIEFQQIFGGASSISLKVNMAANSRTVSSIVQSGAAYSLYYAVKAFYNNGGGTCYISSAGNYTTAVSAATLETALDKLEQVDEPTLILIPDIINLAGNATTRLTDYNTVYAAALDQCARLKDRFVIVDTIKKDINTDTDTEIADSRTKLGMNNLTYGAAYFPTLITGDSYTVDNSNVVFFGTGQAPFTATATLAQVLALNWQSTATAPADALENADYALAIKTITDNIAAITSSSVIIPPSGPIAGVYARTDFDRGVWKAPANVSLSGLTPTVLIDDIDQDTMNVDVNTGKSINAIRNFAGKGTLVWGARTLAGNNPEWRYVNVRRLFIFIEESVAKATGGFVFEPNTAQTWTRIKGMIDNFLTSQWRQGALAGAKPEDAFFVRVGLGSTMNSDDILEGRLNIEIGVAPARPAEFIILKFSHKVQVS